MAFFSVIKNMRVNLALGTLFIYVTMVAASTNNTLPTNATVVEKVLVSPEDVIIINVISWIFVVLVLGGSCGIHWTCKYREWKKEKLRNPTSDDLDVGIMPVCPEKSEIYSVQTDPSLRTAESTETFTSSTRNIFNKTSV